MKQDFSTFSDHWAWFRKAWLYVTCPTHPTSFSLSAWESRFILLVVSSETLRTVKFVLKCAQDCSSASKSAMSIFAFNSTERKRERESESVSQWVSQSVSSPEWSVREFQRSSSPHIDSGSPPVNGSSRLEMHRNWCPPPRLSWRSHVNCPWIPWESPWQHAE